MAESPFINKIICGDSGDILPAFPDECVDLTVTSPPYDNLRTYNGFTFDFENIASELFRVTKLGGVVVWVIGDSSIGGGESGTSFRQALFFMDLGFTLNDTMIYEKPNRRPRQYRAHRYEQVFEYMFVLVKGKKSKTFNPINEPCLNSGKTIGFTSRDARRENNFTAGGEITTRKTTTVKDVKRKGNVWKYSNNSLGINHPAVFPEALVKEQIVSWSNIGDTVLDCFCGSGTTPKMAKLLGRKYVGIEISQEYCNISEKRLENVG